MKKDKHRLKKCKGLGNKGPLLSPEPGEAQPERRKGTLTGLFSGWALGFSVFKDLGFKDLGFRV